MYVRPDEWPPASVKTAEAIDAEDDQNFSNTAQQADNFENSDDVPFC